MNDFPSFETYLQDFKKRDLARQIKNAFSNVIKTAKIKAEESPNQVFSDINMKDPVKVTNEITIFAGVFYRVSNRFGVARHPISDPDIEKRLYVKGLRLTNELIALFDNYRISGGDKMVRFEVFWNANFDIYDFLTRLAKALDIQNWGFDLF